MSWVADRFAINAAYKVEIPKLWDAFRDSMASAVDEYAMRVPETVYRTDCTASGKYCARVRKDGAAIEVFLDEQERTLRVSLDSGKTSRPVACYRVKADRSAAEFCVENTDGFSQIPMDRACELALEEFFFATFPRVVIGPTPSASA